MSRGTLAPQEIKGTNISDIYFVVDSARKNFNEIVNSVGELVFDLKQRGIGNNNITGLLLNNDTLVNVIEIEVGDIYLPLLGDYVTVLDNWTDHFTIPDTTHPPLIPNAVPPIAGAMTQYGNGVISLEIKEAFPQIVTTVDGINITFMFSVQVLGNKLHLVPLIRKFVFSTPKRFQNLLSLSFKGPLAPLELPADILYNVMVKFHVFPPAQRVIEYDNDQLVGAFGLNGVFYSGVYDSLHNRVYFAPVESGGIVLGYIDTVDNTFHEISPASIPLVALNPYESGVIFKNRIYWAPFASSSEPFWHYTDTNTNTMVAYANNSGYTPPQYAFSGAYLNPAKTRVYFVPFEPGPMLVYIDLLTNNVVAYNNNKFSEMITSSYDDGVMTPSGLLYLIPSRQQNETNLHFINTNNNIVYSYPNLPLFVNPYTPPPVPYFARFRGGVLNGEGTKIYLVPSIHASQPVWYYIDLQSNTFVPYANNSVPMPLAGTAYNGGVLTPDNKIYLIPSAAANDANWHYIDLENNSVVAYANDATTIPLVDAYFSGVATDDGRIYMIPNQQTAEAKWHIIDLGITTIKFVHNNHGLVLNDRLYIENFYSTNAQIDRYLNRKKGLVVGANTTANEIFINPMIDVQHNSVKILTFSVLGTYSPSVTIILNKNRFFVNLRFRTLAEETTNRIIPI